MCIEATNGFRAAVRALVLQVTSCAAIHAETILFTFEVFGFGEWTAGSGTHSVNFHGSGLIGQNGNGRGGVGRCRSDRSVHGLGSEWRRSHGINGRSGSRKRSGEHLSDKCSGTGLGRFGTEGFTFFPTEILLFAPC